MERREALESPLQDSKVEVEQNCAIFALPNMPQQYISYDGTQVPDIPGSSRSPTRFPNLPDPLPVIH